MLIMQRLLPLMERAGSKCHGSCLVLGYVFVGVKALLISAATSLVEDIYSGNAVWVAFGHKHVILCYYCQLRGY